MKAIIFDLDGTLINSVPLHRKAIQRVSHKLQINITQEDMDKFNGMTRKQQMLYFQEQKKLSKEKIQEFEKAIIDYKEGLELHVPLFKDTIKCLEKYKKRKLAIATSSNRFYLQNILDKFNLKKYFTATITGDEVKHSKPHPQIFLEAAKKLHEKPSNCIVVEDAVNGIIAANRAAMGSVALLTSTPKEMFTGEGMPNKFITCLAELVI